jgi:NAD(P)-dependent dehydrogenase (short-subunit alcohol dehydrogenase family)
VNNPTLTPTQRPVTLITGGSRGLGAAMARALAANGHDLLITYQTNTHSAAAVVADVRALGARAEALALDVTDSAAIPAFVATVQTQLAKWGAAGLQGLVNNAGFGVHARLADTTAAQFDALLAVHLRGPFLLTQALTPVLSDNARIVNISTGLTRFTSAGYGVYAAMKGAMEVLTRYQAQELAARGIRVNSLAPGATATDFGGGAVRDNAALNAHLGSLTALGRVGQADDIGGALAALMQPGAGWITGQRIEASGGMNL